MMRRSLIVLVFALALALAVPAQALGSPHGTKVQAEIAKKCKKKGKKKKCKKRRTSPVQVPAPIVAPPLPTPLALTEAEVTSRVDQRASTYCAPDPDCFAYGHYEDSPGHLECASRTTYTWACYGFNDEDYVPHGSPDETCDFREIVSRSGHSGITSHQDLSFGGTGFDAPGWDCGPYTGP